MMASGRGAKGLDPEGQALWRKVTADVKPLDKRGKRSAACEPLVLVADRPAASRPVARVQPLAEVRHSAKTVAAKPSETLDGGWDRRLRRGAIIPERTIDLHGHTLESAHGALDHALERSLADDVRVLLVITGKPMRADDSGRRRGLIRAAIGGWLDASRHRLRIAAIRNAHPRHGGDGALYLILRRRREVRPGPV